MSTHLRIKRKEYVSPNTLAIYFNKPDLFDYDAGQFAKRHLSNDENESNAHIFSLITSPYQDEIGFVTRIRDTSFKQLLDKLKVWDDMRLKWPRWDFKLHDDTSKKSVFIIDGIGIAPVISIIRQATYELKDHDITLLYINKDPNYILFEDELISLHEKNNNFTLFQLSNNPNNQNAESDHIDKDVIKKHVSNLSETIFYLSGPQNAVQSAQFVLKQLDIKPEQIISEEYDGYLNFHRA